MSKKILLLLLSLMVFSSISLAQVNISSGSAYSQNFDAMGTSATATLPTGWKADKLATAIAVGTYSSAVTATTVAGGASMSTSAGNGIYNFGNSVTTTDRAVGGLSSSSASKSVNVYVFMTNNGATTITNPVISYDVEKYRKGSNAAGFSIQMYYSTDGSNWTTAGANFLTSFAADADNTGYATTPGATSSVSNKTLPISVAAGANLYLAWNYSVSTGSTTSNAQALGIDNVVITAPSTQASGLNFSGVTSSSMTINWTNGNGSGRLVKVNTANTFTDPANGTTYTGNTVYSSGEQVVFAGNSNSVTVTGLQAATTYYVQIYEYTGSGANTVYTTTSPLNGNHASASAGTPTISITNSMTGFGNQLVNTTSAEKTYTVGGSNLTANIVITPPSGYGISTTSGSGYVYSPSTITLTQSGGTVATTNIYVVFSPTNAQAYSGSITHTSTGATEQDITLSGTGVGSAASDIILKSGYVSPTNIDYTQYQTTNITGGSNDIEVAQFTVRDGGVGANDADSYPTTLTGITFSLSNYANIRRVALYDGATELGEVAGAATVTFSGLSIVAPDNGTKDFSVRVSFNTVVTDNQQFQFTVTSATASSSGSTFAAADAGAAASSISGTDNKIIVTASKLIFSVQPSTVAINYAISPAIKVEAVDANNSLDLDYVTDISISPSSGNLTGAPVIVTPTAGVATFSSLIFTAAATGITLDASSGSLTGGVSNSFDVTDILLEENFNFSGLLHSNGWSSHSGTGTNDIGTTTGLTFTNYPASGIGNAASMNTNGEDVNRGFSPVSATGTNVYASFLISITSVATGDYFFHFTNSSGASPGTFLGRLYTKSDGSGHALLGVSIAGEAAVYGTTPLTLGTTYLVVYKYSIVSSGASASSSVWLISSPVAEPTAVEGTAAEASTATISTATTTVGGIALRQGSNGAAPQLTIDGIRISAATMGAVLPVELKSFTSTVQQHRVSLSWKTATEINTNGFSVLRSADGKDSWKEIGFIKATGNSNVPRNYSFTDQSVSNGNYSYKLKIVDNDGTYKFSDESKAVVNTPNTFELSQNYPNPFNPSTMISYSLATDAKVTLKVYNALGSEVATVVNELQSAGPHAVSFSADQYRLASGIYFYKIQAGSFSETRRMMLLK